MHQARLPQQQRLLAAAQLRFLFFVSCKTSQAGSTQALFESQSLFSEQSVYSCRSLVLPVWLVNRPSLAFVALYTGTLVYTSSPQTTLNQHVQSSCHERSFAM